MAEPKDSEKKKPRTPLSRNTWLYIGSVIILIIVVVTFIGAPVATSTMGSQRLVFGRYGNDDIIYQPGNFFARQYEVIAQSLRDAGDQTSLEMQLRLAWREAFNRTVLHKAVIAEAENAGIAVSESRVDEMIAEDPRFQVNGRFDSDAYRATSNQERFTLRGFHRENAVFDQVIRDALTGTRFSSREKRFVGELTGPQRSFDVVRFPFSEFPEDQVLSFISENPDLFTTLDLSVVTLGTEEEAAEVRSRADEEGTPFGDLARTYSRDLYADQDGQIGPVFGYELQQELTNPADLAQLLELDEGEISPLIETTTGWAFYQADAEPTRSDVENEEVLSEARRYMEVYEQGRIQDFVRAEAERFAEVAGTDGFGAAAGSVGREILSTGFFPINYGNSQFFGQIRSNDIPDLSDAAYREDFFEIAFSLESEEVSEPILLRQSALVLRLRDERPVDDDDVEFITEYYDEIARQFYSDEIEAGFVDEEKLEDNFAQAFNRYVLGN
ncbi:MAG: SurA N-terminal domain-containing protein [Alkalispirochaeta sp.]